MISFSFSKSRFIGLKVDWRRWEVEYKNIKMATANIETKSFPPFPIRDNFKSKQRVIMYPAFCSIKNQNRLYSPQEIEKMYQASAARHDLFDHLLDQKIQLAGAETTTKMEESRMDQEPKEVHRHHGCKCSKIGCLKLYCECFANGRQCTSACECTCCHNKPGNEMEILKAKMMANYRHPGQFSGVPAYTPVRKCTCKKSMCRKKYCECYSAGLPCTQFCQCKDCHNGQPHSHDESPSFMKDNAIMEVQVQA